MYAQESSQTQLQMASQLSQPLIHGGKRLRVAENPAVCLRSVILGTIHEAHLCPGPNYYNIAFVGCYSGMLGGVILKLSFSESLPVG